MAETGEYMYVVVRTTQERYAIRKGTAAQPRPEAELQEVEAASTR